MKAKRKLSRPTAESIASYVKKHAGMVKKRMRHQHGEAMTVRRADHKGHRIEVRTAYEIRIDGRRVTGHMGVTNDGRVHYHPVPNVSFASAIDMVKQLIDVFPDDFPKGRRARRGGRRPRGHHHD